MILGIDVAFVHSRQRALADWYADVPGLPKGYGDDGWQSFEVTEVSRFAVDHTGFPRSAVEKQAIVLSFKVDDIRQEVKTLAARGVRFYPSADEAIFDVGPSLVATFIDPDGNWMQLPQRKAIAEGKYHSPICHSEWVSGSTPDVMAALRVTTDSLVSEGQ